MLGRQFGIRAASMKDRYGMAHSSELTHEMRPNEAGAANDQNRHVLRLPRRRSGATIPPIASWRTTGLSGAWRRLHVSERRSERSPGGLGAGIGAGAGAAAETTCAFVKGKRMVFES